MRPVLPAVPLHGRSKEPRRRLDGAKATDLLSVGVEHDLICTGLLDADAIIEEALRGVEIEDENAAGALEHDDLVALVLEADVRLRGVQPAVAVLGQVHLAVELVEVLVPQERVLGEVQLPSRVPERVLVALAREVEPFWVTEFVTLEVEIALAAQAVREQADHLV